MKKNSVSTSLRAVLLLALILLTIPLTAQNTAYPRVEESVGTVYKLPEELEKLQQQVRDETLTGIGRKEAWLSLARLQVLSGDYGAAASSYTEAAFSVPANRDDEALLRAALCFLYIGDFEHASSNSKTVLLTCRDSSVIEQAQLIGAIVDAFRGEAGALQNLETMLHDPAREEQKPLLLFILYSLTGKEVYVGSLKEDYSASMEATILDNGDVSLKYSPLWLFGSLESESLHISEAHSSPEETKAKVEQRAVDESGD